MVGTLAGGLSPLRRVTAAGPPAAARGRRASTTLPAGSVLSHVRLAGLAGAGLRLGRVGHSGGDTGSVCFGASTAKEGFQLPEPARLGGPGSGVSRRCRGTGKVMH